ncbi:NUDIX domain-containing protein [Phytohalomonas tamaricis]|uniref:NUDIX domain-containing protein n=1 Tax=Phytohalomonas tamaricis TaxID=2081032 RepID=UPI000D0AE885|nr:NUDIX domain-containing protein [Phytohalomonas tamaricis]
MTNTSKTPAPHFGKEDVERVETEKLHEGFFDYERRHLRHRQFNGGWSETIAREVHVRPDAVGVLLYDPKCDAVVMVEQFRAGVVGRERSPWLIEPVAGLIDTDESPEEVARREAQEEAGCEVAELIEMPAYYPSPGASSERVQLYCALIDSADLGGVHGLETEHEDILVHVLPFAKAWELLEAGHLDNAMALICLYWLARERASLRARS